MAIALQRVGVGCRCRDDRSWCHAASRADLVSARLCFPGVGAFALTLIEGAHPGSYPARVPCRSTSSSDTAKGASSNTTSVSSSSRVTNPASVAVTTRRDFGIQTPLMLA